MLKFQNRLSSNLISERMKKLILLLMLIFGYFDFCYSQKMEAKLTFIYWMPYDNNLSAWADSIYHMIQTGVQSSDIIVTVQRDISGNSGMTRSIITNKDIVNYEIPDENSWSGKTFNEYMSWVSGKIRSEKYVIIFLDHGGKLDEIGLDEFPKKQYLRIDSARMAIDQFNKANGKKTELVFLQVCTKGSIEPIYEFKELANYTMFSQTTLGAPNFYYSSLFKALSNEDIANINGLDLAKKIVDFEREDMYYSLVCVDNNRFASLESELSIFFSAYESLNKYNVNHNKPLFYDGQSYWDLVAFIESFEGVPNENLLNAIDELIVLNQINIKYKKMNGFCGLSLLAMNQSYLAQIEKYSHLNFFQSFNTKDFYLKSKELIAK
jgi:hypothetical protein